MQKCKKCFLPETYETIEFSVDSCNICNSNINLKKKMDWEKKNKELIELVKKYKGKYDYDCIIPFSGGKDSTFQAYYVVKELKLKPLLIRFNHGFFRQKLKDNTEKTLKKLGVDIIDFTPNWKIVKKLMFESFKRKTDFCWHCHTGIYSYPIRLAIKLNIPFVIFGEPLAEMSAYYDYSETEYEDEEKFDRTRNLGISADDMFGMINSKDDPVDKRDLIPYTFPSKKDYDKAGIMCINLGSFIEWDYEKQYNIINKELGWEKDELEGVPDELNKAGANIECYMQGTRDYLKFVKRGYSRVSQLLSIELRKGNINKEIAEKYVKEEGKKPPSLEIFLEYMGLSEDEFNKIAKSMSIPPYEHKFGSNEKIAKKTKDFSDWYREKD